LHARYRLFTLRQEAPLYSVEIHSGMLDAPLRAKSEAELLDALKKVFAHSERQFSV
jgi:hypothetical protein